jgi:hypothetical protein
LLRFDDAEIDETDKPQPEPKFSTGCQHVMTAIRYLKQGGNDANSGLDVNYNRSEYTVVRG